MEFVYEIKRIEYLNKPQIKIEQFVDAELLNKMKIKYPNVKI